MAGRPRVPARRSPNRTQRRARTMNFHEPAVLGRTGRKVGRLGIASGYGVPTVAIEEAFERGCNYFTWGTVIKGYMPGMGAALKAIVAKGQRDRLVLAAFTYAHNNFLT